jgi:hypothetical protein
MKPVVMATSSSRLEETKNAMRFWRRRGSSPKAPSAAAALTGSRPSLIVAIVSGETSI